MYLSLARKYRPKNFASVAVQEHVSETLKGAIARGRVAHGYLLCGPRGVGKTTLARVLAMALNCERRSERTDGEPCGECASCTRIWSGSASLDVVEIDAASNRGVDDARELRERAMYAPSSEDRYKVYIVDEAHMLTREAWNALLKVLEEPPPRVVFVFATTEPQKIAQAAAPVLSRLQRFDFKRMTPADVRERLAAVLAEERVEAEPDALGMLARAADGSMRDALSLTDQVLSVGDGAITAARVREALGLVPEDEYVAMLDLVAERRAGEIFAAVSRQVDAGVDLGAFLTGFADVVRAQLAIALGGSAPDVSERLASALAQRTDRLAPPDLLRMLQAIGEIEPRFRRSGQQQLLLETLLVRLALLDRTVAIEELLRGLEGGRGPRAEPRPEGRAEGRRPEPRASGTAPPRPNRPAPPPEAAAAPAPSVQRPEPAVAVLDRPAASAAPSAPPAAAPRRGDARPALDANRLAERWQDVVAGVRARGRQLVATALERAFPAAVSGRGDVSIELEEPNVVLEEAISNGAPDVLAAIGELFSGATRVVVRASDRAPAQNGGPKRLTEEQIRSERLATLRKRDAALDAAVEMLDLELMD